MTPYDDAFTRAHADALRAEDTAAWDDFNECHDHTFGDLTEAETARVAYIFGHLYPERIHTRYTPKDTPCTSTPTNTPLPATTRIHVSTRSIDGLPPMTVRAEFAGTRSCRAAIADSASSRGPSTSSGRPWPGARLARLIWFGLTKWKYAHLW